jgi:hypothetical protein
MNHGSAYSRIVPAPDNHSVTSAPFCLMDCGCGYAALGTSWLESNFPLHVGAFA